MSIDNIFAGQEALDSPPEEVVQDGTALTCPHCHAPVTVSVAMTKGPDGALVIRGVTVEDATA